MTVHRYMARIIGADPQHDTPVPVVLTADHDRALATERGKLEAADAENDRLAARVAELKAVALETERHRSALKSYAAELERRITEHDEGCRDICGRGDQEAVRCGYRSYFVNSRRRCPECPMGDIIGLPDADAPEHGT